jgi:uncharacterized protein YecE (DUF72 family)
MNIYIGCSGYSYKDWRKKFYPEDLPEKKWLSYYSEKFNTVEINNTFYKYPTENQLQQWVKNTPDDFKFTIKGHRFFTHMKKLKSDDSFMDSLNRFMGLLDVLEDKLACILWQLPGNLHKDIERLDEFFKKTGNSAQHVIEFRHRSWFDELVYEKLRHHKVSFCILSAPNGLPEDTITTSKTAYLRFHGKSTWYNYEYSNSELKTWTERLEKLEDIDDLFIYFNNDNNAYAVKNALKLMNMLNLPVELNER